MKFKKEVRYENQENKDYIKTFPCIICGKSPVDVEHWKTVKSGGGDELFNLNPMCRLHHHMKGYLGVKTFYGMFETRIVTMRSIWGLPKLKLKGE